jgi:hypothetical protein
MDRERVLLYTANGNSKLIRIPEDAWDDLISGTHRPDRIYVRFAAETSLNDYEVRTGGLKMATRADEDTERQVRSKKPSLSRRLARKFTYWM